LFNIYGKLKKKFICEGDFINFLIILQMMFRPYRGHGLTIAARGGILVTLSADLF
jgi:hypothetical protein